ncbi:hypothetical protein [Klebsiella pneumoniae IS10]|nr:hypothetical protein [Klebsiella pneumoniae IS10]
MDRQRAGIVMAIADDRQHLRHGPFSHSAISLDSSALPMPRPPIPDSTYIDSSRV